MSLAAIQDNLVKAPLVQQTQTRGDDVARGQEIGQAALQKEENRRMDEVVLHTQETENQGVRTDEEREKEGKKKKRGEEEQQDESDADAENAANPDGTAGEGETAPRAVMRQINIVI